METDGLLHCSMRYMIYQSVKDHNKVCCGFKWQASQIRMTPVLSLRIVNKHFSLFSYRKETLEVWSDSICTIYSSHAVFHCRIFCDSVKKEDRKSIKTHIWAFEILLHVDSVLSAAAALQMSMWVMLSRTFKILFFFSALGILGLHGFSCLHTEELSDDSTCTHRLHIHTEQRH